MSDKLITSAELVKALSIGKGTLYKWLNEGMPHIKLGPKMFRFNLAEVIAWREGLNK